jgi:hypothetical protein
MQRVKSQAINEDKYWGFAKANSLSPINMVA